MTYINLKIYFASIPTLEKRKYIEEKVFNIDEQK